MCEHNADRNSCVLCWSEVTMYLLKLSWTRSLSIEFWYNIFGAIMEPTLILKSVRETQDLLADYHDKIAGENSGTHRAIAFCDCAIAKRYMDNKALIKPFKDYLKEVK